MASLIPDQYIDLTVQKPANSANLSISPGTEFQYDPNEQAWVIKYPSLALFELSVPQLQTIRFTITMRSKKGSDPPVSPIKVVVNKKIVVPDFVFDYSIKGSYQFFLPGDFFRTGTNMVGVSNDRGPTDLALYQVDVKGVEPALAHHTTMDFQNPVVHPTNKLSIASQQGTAYNSTTKAWEIAAGGYINFTLELGKAPLVAVAMNFSSTIGPGRVTNNPFEIRVEPPFQNRIWNYDPHRMDFHEESWLLPTNWRTPGKTSVKITVHDIATTKLALRSFGIQALLDQPSKIKASISNQGGLGSASWTADPAATGYNIEFYKTSNMVKPIFSMGNLQSLRYLLPNPLAVGAYQFRVQGLDRTVPGPWGDFVKLNISRALYLFSADGLSMPGQARSFLTETGVLLYVTIDDIHAVGLTDDAQLAKARSIKYFSSIYTAAISNGDIGKLPINQQPIAKMWNFYLSAAYQDAANNPRDDGKSWGDPVINAPISWLPLTGPTIAEMYATTETSRGERQSESSESCLPLTGNAFQDFGKTLRDSLGDPTAARFSALAGAHSTEKLRFQLVDPTRKEGLISDVASAPRAQANDKIVVALITVQSNKKYGDKPSGWLVKKSTTTPTTNQLVIVAGLNDPQPGDTFKLSFGHIGTYTVTSWHARTMTVKFTPSVNAQVKENTVLSFLNATRWGPRLSQVKKDSLVLQVREGLSNLEAMAPLFHPNGWILATSASKDARALSIIGGQTIPQKGQAFKLNQDQNVYIIDNIDTKSMSLTLQSALVKSYGQNARLTFTSPKKLAFDIVESTVEINPGWDYSGIPWGSDTPNDYWQLPAIGQVSLKGKKFPSTWDGADQYRAALKADRNASHAVVLFLSAFPTNWFAFAWMQRAAITLVDNLFRFDKSSSSTTINALNNRDVTAVRNFLNSGLDPDEEIPASVDLSITIIQWYKHWIVEEDAHNKYQYRVMISDAGWFSPDRAYVFRDVVWQLKAIGQTAGHEMLHIFGASDEYIGKGTPCDSCGGTYGDYKIPNGNCALCMKPQHPCIMAENIGTLCDYTNMQIGWSDVLVEITTSPGSKNTDDEIYVKFGDRIMYHLSDPILDDRVPGQIDPYALGITGLNRQDFTMISIGNVPNHINTPWTFDKVRVWHKGDLIYDRKGLNATIDKTHSWWTAPDFLGGLVFTSYDVAITTGSEWFAGTVDDVTLSLGGISETLNQWWWLPVPYQGFITGLTYSWTLTGLGRNVIANTEVKLEKTVIGIDDEWYPSHIKISGNKQDGTNAVLIDVDINKWLGFRDPKWIGKLTVPAI